MRKQRLDNLMLERGLVLSLEKARALIMAGQVVVGDHTVDSREISSPTSAVVDSNCVRLLMNSVLM